MSRGTADEHSVAGAAVRSSAVRQEASRRGESEMGGVLAYDDFAVTNDPVAGIPGRPAVRASIGRRKKVWIVAAAVGLALGIGLFKEIPPPYKAMTTVNIALIPGVLPTDEVLTEVALAQSRTVAETAMHRIGLSLDPKSVQTFMGHETVVATTDQVIAFTVKASSASDAVARVRALANAYLLVRNLRLDMSRQRAIQALDQQITILQKKITARATKITKVQAEPTSAVQQAALAKLQVQQSQAESGLTSLAKAAQGYAQHSQVSNQKVETGSSILDQASAAPRSKIKYPALYAVGGLLAGLAVGMGWVIITALVSTRPRRRFDVARALGTPVRLSVGRIRVSRRAALRAPEGAGGRGIQQIARHLHSALPTERGRVSLAVVAADDLVVPALSVVSLALSCVREGKRVIVADLTSGAAAGQLLGCAEPGVYGHVAGGHQLSVAIPADADAPPTGPVSRGSSTGLPRGSDPELDHAYHAADVLLTLLTVDPGFGADHLRSWARDAVVILTAGKPSATKLRTLSELIRLSGTSLKSAVVVGADQSDESLGVLTSWDDDAEAGRAEQRPRRDVQVAQSNGAAARGRAKPDASERSFARPEVQTDARSEARAEVRAEPGPEARAESRREARVETRTDARREPRTDPLRPAVDLSKVRSRRPDEAAAPEAATRPEDTHRPESRPYADDRENVIGSGQLGTWLG